MNCPLLPKNASAWAGTAAAQLVKCLPGKHEDLSSSPQNLELSMIVYVAKAEKGIYVMGYTAHSSVAEPLPSMYKPVDSIPRTEDKQLPHPESRAVSLRNQSRETESIWRAA